MPETEQPPTPHPTPEVDFDYITLDFEISCVDADPGDPGEFSVPVVGKIFASCDAAEEGRVEIGYVDAIIVRIGQAMEAGYGPWTTLDAHSHETCECMELFEDQDFSATIQRMFPDAIWIDDILLVTRVEIRPEYRGHNAGLVAMRTVIDMFGRGCSLVVCKPFPLQYESKLKAGNKQEFRAAQKKVRGHWAKVGFERIPKTDLYALSMANKLPDLPPIKH